MNEHYKRHVFFCTNQRDQGRQCCQNAGAKELCLYTKEKVKSLGLAGPQGTRVSLSGCLGRCSLGPTIVIYPEGTWYTYESQQDIDEIIFEHLQHGKIVERLLIAKEKTQ